jgi:hypothetical protein
VRENVTTLGRPQTRSANVVSRLRYVPMAGGGSATMSCTLSVRPWLHSDNFSELVDFMKTQASYKNETPAIVSITRLGV